jgi:hypothetical protein
VAAFAWIPLAPANIAMSAAGATITTAMITAITTLDTGRMVGFEASIVDLLDQLLLLPNGRERGRDFVKLSQFFAEVDTPIGTRLFATPGDAFERVARLRMWR